MKGIQEQLYSKIAAVLRRTLRSRLRTVDSMIFVKKRSMILRDSLFPSSLFRLPKKIFSDSDTSIKHR
jgi:hypothetical protein